MAVTVTHTTAATGVDAGDGSISKDAWNEGHTVAGGIDNALSNASADTGTLTLDTETDMPGCSISLTAGNWIIGGDATSSSGTAVYILAVITTAANAHVSMGRALRATGTPVTISVPAQLVSPSVTTTYKMRVQSGASSGTFLRYASGTTPGTSIWAIQVE